MVRSIIPTRLAALVLFLVGGAAHRNAAVRAGQENHEAISDGIAKTPSDDSSGIFHNRRQNHHSHDHVHVETDGPEPHEPCGARISPEDHRMMDEAQEVWEEQNPDRNRRLRQGRSLARDVKIDVWFHV